MKTMSAKVVHATIARDWREVYDFAHKPENMPQWASGLADGIKQVGDHWEADGGPLGTVKVKFTPFNSLGVMDHHVTLPDGTGVDNALRVIPNGDGAEVMFTVLQTPGMDNTQFAVDADHVRKDLAALKALLEK